MTYFGYSDTVLVTKSAKNNVYYQNTILKFGYYIPYQQTAMKLCLLRHSFINTYSIHSIQL